MPKFTSQAQRAAFAIAAEHPEKSRLNIPQTVAKRAMREDPGGKLPAHAPGALARKRAELLRRRANPPGTA